MSKKRTTFDVIVIGGGSAGFSAAEAARSQGVSVAVVEKGLLGGECPNWACVPTKALLRSAHAYRQAQRMPYFGVHTGRVTYHFKEVMQRKSSVVSTITGGGERYKRIFQKLNVRVIQGGAQFKTKTTIEVEGAIYQAKTFVIATGASDAVPPIEGLEQAGYWGFRDIVQLKKQPKSVAIIGGGPVGCEFATFFSSFGTRVSLLQLSSQILHREDPEIAGIAAKELADQGVNLYTNTKTLQVEKRGFKKRVTLQVGKQQRKQIMVDQVVIATGKRANLDGLGLEAAKVLLDEKGRLVMKPTLQTSQPHIFAAGDVSGGFMFTHVGHYEGHIAGLNAASRAKKSRKALRTIDLRVVPRVTFVTPEIASVGLTPQEAKAAKKNIVVGSFPVGALGRAVTESDRRGLVKLVADKKTGKILGGHIAASRAGEMIHEVALAMHLNATALDLSEMLHAYPTYSEAITAAAGELL